MHASSDASCTFVIPAAGAGTRFGAALPKQYAELAGEPLIVHTLRHCLDLPGVSSAVVAVAPAQRELLERALHAANLDRVRVVDGGATRQESVTSALAALELRDESIVAVHDAVRPFFSAQLFLQLISVTLESGAALPILPLSDTLHRVVGGAIVETPDRDEWGLAQTPQCFRYGILRRALQRAKESGETAATDEAGLVARFGGVVRAVAGEAGNFKVTWPSDLHRAESVLRSRSSV